jgi:uncharacterized membrane protein
VKIILYILGGFAALLVICVLVLVALNMRTDSNRIVVSTTIHRPPSQVWPYLYEGDKLKAWVTWLQDVQRQPGPPQVGASQVWVMQDMNNGGATMKINSKITAAEPNRRLAVDLSVPGAFDGTAEYRLTDLGSATRVEADSRYHLNNWFAGLMTPLVVHEASKKAQSDLEKMRAAVEATQ